MQARQCVAFATAIATGVAFALAPVYAQAQQNPATASARGFPSRPVRVVVPNPAGSQGDALARMIAQKLSDAWGQPVVIENRTGGVGTVAGSTVVKATPDGHTLLQTAGFSISAVLQTNLPYDPLKDFAGVAQIGIGTQVLIVGPALGVKSVKDFIAFAKTQPGKIIYSSSAVGTGSHLNGARFALAAGIKIATVAFKGGPEAVVEVMAGRSHYSSVTLFSALPHVNDGKLVALAVATPQRAPQLPDVPALAETFPDFKRPENSTGILAPAGTPRPILIQISKDVARVLDLPDIKERLQGMGYFTAHSTPEEFDNILRAQIETLSRVVTDAGLRPR
jgi:tripartite-type tricarboxylate transporter receptor subunit TctC